MNVRENEYIKELNEKQEIIDGNVKEIQSMTEQIAMAHQREEEVKRRFVHNE